MATIQVRELPEASYEILRLRARRAGMSLQAYMREQLVRMAEHPTKEEALAQIETVLAQTPDTNPTESSIVADVMADRR